MRKFSPENLLRVQIPPHIQSGFTPRNLREEFWREEFAAAFLVFYLFFSGLWTGDGLLAAKFRHKFLQ
ncbi:MAG: hypothetical protein KH703_04225 [Campylobacter gracilis]|uniref:hypothetical protein n=1 Tax=Campylobacter gracilis TaxID=824 RepID=UPI0026ECD472|nr:hypothetical protein [Campylobacter gracilis]MBS6152604.1 hypothetical protein [Campylobacter gracilis]